jgi:tRNA threonylcarbamoyladenosine modification (KEOPS) complex  Pcc1 subunit
VIVEHWIRPCREGGVELYMRSSAGLTLQARAPSAAALRRALENCLALVAEEREHAPLEVAG